jgi:hypothetical protein
VTRPRRSRWALGLSISAVAWGVALVAAAVLVPAYSDGSTLAQENGAWVLVPAAVPAALAGIAFAGLHRRCTDGSRPASAAAWTAIVLLVAFGIVSILSIGIFALIPALLLAFAASLTRTPTA